MMIRNVPATFTLQQLMAYLAGEAEGAPEGYRTTKEWAEHFGIHPATMRRILQSAKEAGKLSVRQAKRERIDGRTQNTVIYAFLLEHEEVGEAGGLPGQS